MSTRAAVAVLSGDCYMVGFADEGIAGYTPTTYLFETYDEAKACARNMNEKWGLTADDLGRIVLSTLPKS